MRIRWKNRSCGGLKRVKCKHRIIFQEKISRRRCLGVFSEMSRWDGNSKNFEVHGLCEFLYFAKSFCLYWICVLRPLKGFFKNDVRSKIKFSPYQVLYMIKTLHHQNSLLKPDLIFEHPLIAWLFFLSINFIQESLGTYPKLPHKNC